MAGTYSTQDQKLLKAVGDKIRDIRQDRGISQEDLAFKAGLDRTYVGSVERGERNISLINLERIMRALDLTAVDAFKPAKR